VLFLGILLLDDRFLSPFRRLRRSKSAAVAPQEPVDESTVTRTRPGWQKAYDMVKLSFASFMLIWIFYATTVPLIWMFTTAIPFPIKPIEILEPFRIANRYGLFAVMTRGRYEIEFQGSQDGQNWTAYPFRYKPQDVKTPPGIYAPYQPRFDWNLWFASLGSWREYPIVANTEVRLLANDHDVLALFAGNPFPQQPPQQVRAVLWQYWFTSMAEKDLTGNWWRRQFLGLYAPVLEREPDGTIVVIEMPQEAERDVR
jgi:hypothetical protein